MSYRTDLGHWNGIIIVDSVAGTSTRKLVVARNNLVFSALSIFRVEGSVTLKMLNLFIVNQ